MTPETALKVRLHQDSVQWENYSPKPARNAAFDALQGAVGHPGHVDSCSTYC